MTGFAIVSSLTAHALMSCVALCLIRDIFYFLNVLDQILEKWEQDQAAAMNIYVHMYSVIFV